MSIIIPRADMLAVIKRLGLTSGLKLCLDAGDAASYDAAVQTARWLDVAGSGYDFYRGTSAVGDAAEPAFNGTAGKRSSGEYFSFDGGDYFTYDTTNETWMQNIHKDNAQFTFLAWVYFASNASNAAVCGTDRSSSTGFHFRLSTGGVVQYFVQNAGSVVLAVNRGGYTTGVWILMGWSVDEPAGVHHNIRNYAVDTASASYSSPSASNASNTLQIGAAGNAALKALSGNRIASLMFWEGRALSPGEMRAFFLATRGKFGV